METWDPKPGDSYPCACGCGEILTYSGIGRPQIYVNETHKKRAYRARKNSQFHEFRGQIGQGDTG